MLVMVDNFDKIIRESINSIVEGLDLDPVYGTVSMNPNHQNYVDTNDAWSPHPYYTTINGYKVISLFKNKWEHNPLIWALKNKKWKFKNPQHDIMFLLRRLVAVTKELHENFDVIITTPSASNLNNELLSKIKRLSFSVLATFRVFGHHICLVATILNRAFRTFLSSQKTLLDSPDWYF
jgi:hypothetical protein